MFFSAILDSKTSYRLDEHTPESSVVHITKAVLQEPKTKGLLYIKSTGSSQYPEVVVASLNEKSPQVELDLCVVHGQGLEFRMNPPCKVALVGYVDPTPDMMMDMRDDASVSDSAGAPDLSKDAVDGDDSDSDVDGSDESVDRIDQDTSSVDEEDESPEPSLANKSQKDQVQQIMDELSINDNSDDSVVGGSSDTGSESNEDEGEQVVGSGESEEEESSSEEAPEPVKVPDNKKRRDAPEKKASPAKKKKEETKPAKETKAKADTKPKSSGDPEGDFEKALIASLKTKSRIPLGALGMEVKKPKEIKAKYADFIKSRPNLFKMQGHMVELKEK